MRRKDRLITDPEARSILKEGGYGVLSTVSPNSAPYGVPLNYCVIGDGIYFHCASKGTKVDNIENNPNVSFCVVGRNEVLPDKFSTAYKSCIVQGVASEIFEEEKIAALEKLIYKYSEHHIPEGLKYIEKLKDKTRVFRIAIDSISGKANQQ